MSQHEKTDIINAEHTRENSDNILLRVLHEEYEKLVQNYKGFEPMRHVVCEFNSPDKAFSAYCNSLVPGVVQSNTFVKFGITKMCCSLAGCIKVTKDMMIEMLQHGTHTIGIGYNVGNEMDVQIPGILTGKVNIKKHNDTTRIGAARREIREELGLSDDQFCLNEIQVGVYKMILTFDKKKDDCEMENTGHIIHGDKIHVLFAGSEADMLKIAPNIRNVVSDAISHFIICPVQVSIKFLNDIRHVVAHLLKLPPNKQMKGLIEMRYFITKSYMCEDINKYETTKVTIRTHNPQPQRTYQHLQLQRRHGNEPQRECQHVQHQTPSNNKQQRIRQPIQQQTPDNKQQRILQPILQQRIRQPIYQHLQLQPRSQPQESN
jgi:hypothetical protein